MIEGQGSVNLSRAEQHVVATWAAKTALMLDLASGDPVVPLGFYYELRQRREPPSGQGVFLAAYNGSSWAIRTHLKRLGGDEPHGFACTCNIFRLVFQVCGSFMREAHLDDRRKLTIGLLRIWPAEDEDVSWPRDRLAFNDELLIALGDSIN
jgi:hypothetical protein